MENEPKKSAKYRKRSRSVFCATRITKKPKNISETTRHINKN